MIPAIPILDAVLSIGDKVIDRLWPDPVEKEKAKIAMAQMAQAGEFKELETRMSAIIAEANSSDPWTSRARPLFYYVFYAVIAALVLIAPTVGVFFPDRMMSFFTNVRLGFEAIPEAMWWTFISGFLGYSGLRTFEKTKGVSK